MEKEIPLLELNIDSEELYDIIKDLDFSISKKEHFANKEKDIKKNLDDLTLEAFFEKYESDDEYPGTCKVVAEKDDETAEYLFAPSDRYSKLNEKQAKKLKEIFDEDIVEKKETLKLNPAIIDKYEKIIADMIEESDEIDEEDKLKLFIKTEEYSIKKGTISKLNEYVNSDLSYKEAFELIKPVKPAIKSIKLNS
jgi:hypothetical protein